jgi:hypothetical protein
MGVADRVDIMEFELWVLCLWKGLAGTARVLSRKSIQWTSMVTKPVKANE